jgi:hypothetical protein
MQLEWIRYPSGMWLASANQLAYTIDQGVLRCTPITGWAEEIGKNYRDLEAAKVAAQQDLDKRCPPPEEKLK